VIEVDAASPVPPYEQVRAQVAALIESGELIEGARLPAIRQLAGDLGLAPGTVARAYRELEAAGLVVSRVRHGTTVAARARPTAAQSRARLAEAARAYAAVTRTLGLTRDQAIAAFERELPPASPTV
jgi:DNA-binding transcriptional regulator YhcF (GntR family)